MTRTWLSRLVGVRPIKATSRRHARLRFRFNPLSLERLEDRSLLTTNPFALGFEVSTGQLSLRGETGDNSAFVAMTGVGFLEVTLNGQNNSSDPHSPFFNPVLAGATRATVSQIVMAGRAGTETLVLGRGQWDHDLIVAADGTVVVEGPVAVGGSLAITASTLDVQGAILSARIDLSTTGLIHVEGGATITARDGVRGGYLAARTQVFINGGQFTANGTVGGNLILQASNVMNAGAITADGSSGDGGTVSVAFTGAYVDTVTARTAADGGPDGHGGSVMIAGGPTSQLFSSGSLCAAGTQGGGSVTLLGQDLELVGTTVDASGAAAGGLVRIGGDPRIQPAVGVNAQRLYVAPSTHLQANSHPAGAGGRVVVWSDGDTEFYGEVSARGGRSGGFIEVSAGGTLHYDGTADAGAAAGKAGTLLLDPKNLVISSAPTGLFPQFNLIDPHPNAGGRFGSQILVLSTGNVVVTDPSDDLGGTGAGAVYLINGQTGILISALVGSNAGDQVGSSSVTVLSSGNYVVGSPNWNGGRGAVTWGSGVSGVSGAVSAANSLIGSNAGDQVGSFGVTVLSNGNYVVSSPSWNGNRGAATWGNGTTGISGLVAASNSLVGSNAGDQVSSAGITVLSNGNYVVDSPNWNGTRGAATWGNGTTGISGLVAAGNSLVGSAIGDQVGSFGVIPLFNGNYVVLSPNWTNNLFTAANAGAATWGNGTTGISGAVAVSNSLVGNNPGDQVGRFVTVLSNSNYVVSSPNWNFNFGAATWGNGTSGVSGAVSANNSLVGSNRGDQVGSGVTPLSNGNYVVSSPSWTLTRGAATWGNGTTGVSGPVSPANSLVGSITGDQVGSAITPLSNGNYVVSSPSWNGTQGAATWGNGATGVSGLVAASNSLVGSATGDRVGSRVTALFNGNYVVSSPNWNSGRGAATRGSGLSGISGAVAATNSLVGSAAGDQVGSFGVTPLSNGNYVVRSPSWNGGRGAATWGNGTTGVSGLVAASNSLVGGNAGDQVSSSGIRTLSNGNYVVLSPNWTNGAGAATWGSGTSGVSGAVSATNSLVGSNAGDQVGSLGVTILINGNYVVSSPNWNGGRGAATWSSSTAGVSGSVAASNSLVGSNPGDHVSSGFGGQRVSNGIIPLADGNYVVVSPDWNSNAGAVTWDNGTTGKTLDGSGVINPQNSLTGQVPSSGLSNLVEDRVHHTFLGSFISEGSGRVTAGFVDPNLLTFSLGQSQTITVTPDFLTRTLNTGTAVILQASNDITVNNAIIVNNPGGNGGNLTLDAGRSILLNASITTDNGNLILIANDALASGVVDGQRDPGAAVLSMAAGTTIDAGAGTVTIDLRDGAGKTNRTSGAITLAAITAQTVSVTNRGPTAASDVILGTITATGTVNLSATGAIGKTSTSAVNVNAVSLVASASSSIDLNLNVRNLNATTTNSPITLSEFGTVLVNGLNAGSGTVTLNLGVFNLGSASVLATAAPVVVNAPAELNLNGFSLTIGSLAGSGNVVLDTSTLATGGANTSTTFSGVLRGSGGLIKQGTGTLILSGANTYTGPTTINQGTLQLGAAERLADSTAVTVAGGAVFNLNSFNETVGSLAGAGSVVLGNGTLTTGGDNTSTAFSGVLSGSGGLTKVGSGTFILSGNNTYSGTTTINGGVLLVNGSQPNSPVTLNTGTLGGPGGVGPLTANGGIVAPGPNAPLTVSGAAHFTSQATLQITVSGTQSTPLHVTGGMNPGGSLLALVAGPGFNPPLNTDFTVILNDSSTQVNGTFRGILSNGTVTFGLGNLNQVDSEGALFLGANGLLFEIGYTGGRGTDVTATRASTNLAVVREMYHDVLGRTSDKMGANYWTNLLDNGSTRAAVSASIWTSTEHHRIEVNQFYNSLLHRNGEPAGVAYWTGQLDSGVPEYVMATLFVTSPEYTAQHFATTDFVVALYNELLERSQPPTGPEVDNWVRLIQSGAATRAQVATFFLASDEEYALAVQQSSQLYLGRPMSASEIQFFFSIRNSVASTPTGLSSMFLASDEFYLQAPAIPGGPSSS